jgi:ABC-type dipeptide/oligopeptide/nickel transport system permease component/ABC-type dipeptide/oligopeptide/nickel transport system permease subunit
MGSETQSNLTAWLQFPRRVILWLVAFGLASALILSLRETLLGAAGAGIPELDWTVSMASQRPVAEMIGERLPNSLLLLGAGLTLALILAAVITSVAALLYRLVERLGPPGSVLGWVGRLALFALTTAPAFVLGVLLLYIFAIRLELFPISGMRGLADPEDAGVQFRYLFLPALTLALLPGSLAGQAVARKITLPGEARGWRSPRAGLLEGLGLLVGQTGGILSALVLVETVFAWPGLGRLLFDAIAGRDLPVVLGVLRSLIGPVLASQLAAELFYWLARLLGSGRPLSAPAPSPWSVKARRLWLALALALLLIPLGLAVGGLLIDPALAFNVDLINRNAPPSAEHPWGVDELGRDVRARLLRGTLVTLGTAALAAGLSLIPAGIWGGLAGALAARRLLWTESVTDLLLLPVYALSLIPIIPGVMVLSLIFAEVGAGSLSLLVAFILLPRLIRLCQNLALVIFSSTGRARLGLIGLSALLLGGLFAGFHLITALEFLGLGLAPPTPTLGGSFRLSTLMLNPGSVLTAGAITTAIALALYTGTEALISFFNDKEGLVHLNE